MDTVPRIAMYPVLGIALLCIIAGCDRAQQSYLTVQMCLVDQRGVEQFKDKMRAIAKSENLEFVDDSAETGVELKTIGADKALGRDPASAINVGIKSDGRVIVMGGNLGLPPFQVALGFGAGSDPIKAHHLSDRLVQALSQPWHVETVPQGQGVFPMKSCGG